MAYVQQSRRARKHHDLAVIARREKALFMHSMVE